LKTDAKKFHQQAHDLVRLIPNGRVTIYGAIAKELGAARSSRLVSIDLIK
jgi:methylated-DNA-protein-cysteine methyltransferase-like protein